MHYTIYSEFPPHKVFVDINEHKNISWCTTSNLVVEPPLYFALCWYFDMTHSRTHPLLAGYTHWRLVFWLRYVDGGTGESSDGSRSNIPRLLLMKLISSFAGSDWEFCVCWDISLVVIILDDCSETEDSSTSPFDPFPCAGSLLGCHSLWYCGNRFWPLHRLLPCWQVVVGTLE